MCITETWLSDSLFDLEILPTNYTIYRKDRCTRGGGVLIALEESIPSSIIPSPSNLEVISVRIEVSIPISLCTVYIPPKPNDIYVNTLLSYLAEFTSSSEHVIIVGDFNLPDINWSTLTGTSPLSTSFCDLMFDHNLVQFVDSPTHIKGNILDIVLSNTSFIRDVHVEPSQSFGSDHFLVLFNIECSLMKPFQKHRMRHVFDFKNADMDGLLMYLLEYDFDSCFHSNNIEHVWAMIKRAILKAMNLYIPKVRVKARKYPIWFNSSIRHHLNCLRTLRKRYKTHPTDQILSKLKSSEKALQEKILSAKTSYEANVICSSAGGNTSLIYRYINTITDHSIIPSIMKSETSTATYDHEKASLFNAYFHSVFTHSSFVLPPIDDLPTPVLTLSDIFVTELDVFTALSSLNPTKAGGIDGIGPRVLKFCATALYQPIYHLFMLSLSQHYIPQEWRVHCITPIHKSGDRSLVNNYRPISLLCTISKVLERIVYNAVSEFVTQSITTAQFGFIRKHSSLQQLLIFISNIMSPSKHTDVLYLDFKKAFDSVAHNELLVKLWRFGITGNLWHWFRGYLLYRCQCVCVKNVTSGTLPVLSGVPQGSILGPLMFLIFVNDLPMSVSSSHLLLFADDTKCLKQIDNSEDCSALQQDLHNLTQWSEYWNLHFNDSKCVLLRFLLRIPDSSFDHIYYIKTQPVARRESHKDLGILISEDLSWIKHYDYLQSKAYKKLGFLRRTLSKTMTIHTKKVLYTSLVRSQLTYCSPIWRPQFLKDIQSIENVQRRATKFILHDYKSCYKSRLVALHLLPLMMQFELIDILFFISSLKCPTERFNIFQYVTFSATSTRVTSRHKLVHNLCRTNRDRHFYFNRLPRLWNSLPIIDVDQSLNTIKRKLKCFFWSYFVANFDPENLCSYHFVCPCNKCVTLPVMCTFQDVTL